MRQVIYTIGYETGNLLSIWTKITMRHYLECIQCGETDVFYPRGDKPPEGYIFKFANWRSTECIVCMNGPRKVCRKCKALKENAAFSPYKVSCDGRHQYCLKCQAGLRKLRKYVSRRVEQCKKGAIVLKQLKNPHLYPQWEEPVEILVTPPKRKNNK